MWCHEWFDLPEAPDIVTFSKKMLTGGLYHKPELRPKQAWRIFNTWVGDPSKVRVVLNQNHQKVKLFLFDDQLVLLKAVLDTIETDNLLENTMKSGDTLLSGLLDLQVSFEY